MERTIESVGEEISALKVIADDNSFDSAIIDDARALIMELNEEIVALGGQPASSTTELDAKKELNRNIVKKMKGLNILKGSSELARKKLIGMNLIFKSKFGGTYQDYLDGKIQIEFESGGSVSSEAFDLLSKDLSNAQYVVNFLLRQPNFFFVKGAQSDTYLSMTKPEGAQVLTVILNKSLEFIFALVFESRGVVYIEFYSDDFLTKKLDTYTFYELNSGRNEAKLKYDMISINKLLANIDEKYFSESQSASFDSGGVVDDFLSAEPKNISSKSLKVMTDNGKVSLFNLTHKLAERDLQSKNVGINPSHHSSINSKILKSLKDKSKLLGYQVSTIK